MKVAVPTDDGKSISAHFGRCAGFLVFDLESGAVVNSQLRKNDGCKPHTDGVCHGHDPEVTPHDHAGHDHGGMVSSISDCQVVVCRGIGQGARDALSLSGIQVAPVDETGAAASIVEAYVAGRLKPGGSNGCRCSH